MAEFQSRRRDEREPGAPDAPLPPSTDKVEPKVKAGTAAGGSGAAVGAFLVWLLSTYAFNGQMPAPVEAVLYLVGPGVLAAVGACVAGYRARHQWRYRPDERPVR
jgi:hypothetical protein